MQKKNTRFALPLLLALSFAAHCALNFLSASAPTVVIDEGLYTNIARSLAWKVELAFRGQPVAYPFLLYPLLLAPLYRLQALTGGDMYRIVQVFGTLLITSASLPAYLLTMDLTGDRRRALQAALVTACMPDMIFGAFQMAECAVWPLSLWLAFAGLRSFTRRTPGYALLTALLTGLLYFAKPGAAVMGCAMMAARFLYVLQREKQPLRRAVLPLFLLLAALAAGYALYRVLFGPDADLLGLYAKQTSEWAPGDAAAALKAFPLMLLLFAFAAGGFYALAPLTLLRRRDGRIRAFAAACVLGLLLTCFGVAVFVVPYARPDADGLPLHLRYCAMYLPVFYALTCAAENGLRERERGLALALLCFALLCLFPGVRAGVVPGHTNAIDSAALSAFIPTGSFDARLAGWAVTLSVAAFSLILACLFWYGKQTAARRIPFAFLLALLIVQSVFAHLNARFPVDPALLADAREVSERVGDREYLGVTQRYYDDLSSYWLDSRLNRPMQQVTFDQMFASMEETEGVYIPFVPEEQAPNVHNHLTPDTNLLLLGYRVAEHLELAPSVRTGVTANGCFTFAEIQPGVRWLDTMLYGLDGDWLYEGETAYLDAFGGICDGPNDVTLLLTAAGSGSLIVDGQEVRLTGQPETHTLTVSLADMVEICAVDGDAEILGYRTERK